MAMKAHGEPVVSMECRFVHGAETAIFFDREGVLVLVLADGVIGAPGARAAERVAVLLMGYLRAHKLDLRDPVTWVMLLAQLDTDLCDEVDAGECGVCLVAIADGVIVGASVGESCALLVGERGSRQLTERQHVRPRVGDGGARPVAFGPVEAYGRLVVVSDGLLRVASLHEIAGATRRAKAGRLAPEVAALAGPLAEDDVTVLGVVFET